MTDTKTLRQEIVEHASWCYSKNGVDDPEYAVGQLAARDEQVAGYIGDLTDVSYKRLLSAVKKRGQELIESAKNALTLKRKNKGRNVPAQQAPVQKQRRVCDGCGEGYGTLYQLREDHPDKGFTKGQWVHRKGCREAALDELLKIGRRELARVNELRPELRPKALPNKQKVQQFLQGNASKQELVGHSIDYLFVDDPHQEAVDAS